MVLCDIFWKDTMHESYHRLISLSLLSAVKGPIGYCSFATVPTNAQAVKLTATLVPSQQGRDLTSSSCAGTLIAKVKELSSKFILCSVERNKVQPTVRLLTWSELQAEKQTAV